MDRNILLTEVNKVRGCKFISLTYVSDCKFPQKSGLCGVKKRVTTKGAQFNFEYENAVNNHLEKQGMPRTFVAKSLRFGTWFIFNKVIQHNGEFYLRYYIPKNAKSEVTYIESDGTPCTANRVAAIKAYLATKAKPTSKTQENAGLFTDQVDVKQVAFSNIESITLNKKTLSENTPTTLAA